MMPIKEININGKTLIGLDKICFAVNSPATENDKIQKNPTKESFIKAPMAMFAFDTFEKWKILGKRNVWKILGSHVFWLG